MAVVSAERHWNGVTGEARLDESREYTALYRVQTSSRYDQPETITSYFAANGPYLGFVYQFGNDIDIGAVCDSIRPKRLTEHELLWDVEFHYSTAPAREGQDENGNKTGNPLNFRDEIDVSQTSITRTAEKAYRLGGFTGLAATKYPIDSFGDVVNSAGVPFNPTLEKEHKQHVIRITKYRSSYPGGHAALLMHLNDNDWTINKPNYNFSVSIKKHHGQFVSMPASFDFQNGVKYWKVPYEILWDPVYELNDEILDRGLTRRAVIGDPDGRGGTIGFKADGSAMDSEEMAAQMPPGTPPALRIRDAFGDPINEPVKLNGDGQPLKDGEASVWLKYRKFPEGDLSSLGL